MSADFQRALALQAAGQHEAARQAFGTILARSPDDWQARLNRGVSSHRLGDYAAALDDYQAVLAQRPDAVSAYRNFGVLLKDLGEFELAETLLAEALRLDGGDAATLAPLGVVQGYRGRYDDAAASLRRAAQQDAGNAGHWNNLGIVLTHAGRLDEAEAALREALRLAPAHAEARWNLSLCLLYAGRYREAWPLYEARWDAVLRPAHPAQTRWDGRPLAAGSRLLLWAEQGLGDTLMMVRLLPALAQRLPGVALTLACPASLHALLAHNFPWLALCTPEAAPGFDAQLPLMSVAGVLGLERDALSGEPYLTAPPQRVERWRARLGPAVRRRLGLVWDTGAWGVGLADYNRQRKSVPCAELGPLLARHDVDWFSLQLGEAAPAGVVDLGAEIADFADSAAILTLLDALVCADTAIAHLAGALGVQAHVLMRYEGAPFFGLGAASPWYRSLRVWRQMQPGDWAAAVGALAAALEPGG